MVNESNNSLLNILDSMAFNETEILGAFSDIQDWLNQSIPLRSIQHGTWVSNEDKDDRVLEIGLTTVPISYFKAHSLTNACEEDKGLAAANPSPQTMDDMRDRILKLKSLVTKIGMDLSVLESYASRVPLWQIQHHDLPAWKLGLETLLMTPIPDKTKNKKRMILLPLNQEGLPTVERLLSLLNCLVQTDEKICIVAGIFRDGDLPCILPTVRLIEAVNEQKIWSSPIDLLLLDFSTEEDVVNALIQNVGRAFVWGSELPGLVYSSQFSLFSGVFSAREDASSVQYILDATADTESVAESIVSDLWTSGTKMNSRDRAFLFVQEGVHDNIIKQFGELVAKLKVTESFELKATDFIRKKPVVALSAEELQGIKTIPPSSDFTVPTVVYDIGTSSPLLTGGVRGQGHVLFVIPYRNITELIALSNQFGNQKVVSLWTSDPSSIGQISAGVKGNGIWVNSPPQERVRGAADFCNWSMLCSAPQSIPTSNVPSKTKEEFKNALVLANKAMKTWKPVSRHERIDETLRIFQEVIAKWKWPLNEMDKLKYMTDLTSVAGQIEEEEYGGGKLVAYCHKPCGVVGILFVDTANFCFCPLSVFTAILIAAAKGNPVVAVFIGKSDAWIMQRSMETMRIGSLPGCVQCIHAPSTTISQGLQLLALEGQVSHVWIIHAGIEGIRLLDVPRNAFSRIIVDDSAIVLENIRNRGKMVQISTPVHL